MNGIQPYRDDGTNMLLFKWALSLFDSMSAPSDLQPNKDDGTNVLLYKIAAMTQLQTAGSVTVVPGQHINDYLFFIASAQYNG